MFLYIRNFVTIQQVVSREAFYCEATEQLHQSINAKTVLSYKKFLIHSVQYRCFVTVQYLHSYAVFFNF